MMCRYSRVIFTLLIMLSTSLTLSAPNADAAETNRGEAQRVVNSLKPFIDEYAKRVPVDHNGKADFSGLAEHEVNHYISVHRESYENRQVVQDSHEPGTDEYGKHERPIAREKSLYDAAVAYRKETYSPSAKPTPDAEGWTAVKHGRR
jgi:hypothetical protein